MKQVSLFFVCLLTSLSLLAQTSYQARYNINKSVVTIAVSGNKTPQISVDGKEYPILNGVVDLKYAMKISDLESGQHTLLVTRTGQNNNRSEKISTIFSLRRRYDMQINVNANGSLELIEKIKSGTYANKPPMTNANFTTLLNNVKYQRTTSGKRTVITNAFNNTNNYFSSSQVAQLIQQVIGESYRLELAKLSYRTVTDQDNFKVIYNLLSSQASRNELDAFVNNSYDDGNLNPAMTDANFNSLLATTRQQWPVSAQVNTLTSAFNNTNNYFTTDQASQLIQVVTTEGNRLSLAKLSYRSIVDRDNFYQVYELLNSQASRNELETYINAYQDAGGNTGGVAMTDASFNSLYQSIQQQWPVSAQVNALTNAFNNSNNSFTTYQASRLIQLVSAESSRLQLAKLSYRSITDRANFTQVYSLLSSQASKNDLATYVDQYNAGVTISAPGTKVAMTDADFNIQYRNVQMQFLPGGKMTTLTNIFNTSSFYFTSSQTRQLIELLSSESNRLQLAKLSYRAVTDRANFTQVYDLFSSQSSKDELQAYVNAYVD